MGEFCSKYNLKVRSLSFCGIIISVKSLWNSNWHISNDNTEEHGRRLAKTKRASSLVYMRLIKPKREIAETERSKEMTH